MEGEERGSGERERKGRGQCWHEPYIHIIFKRQLRTENYVSTTCVCT